MVYQMVIDIDGACRGSGQQDNVPVGGAGAVAQRMPRLNRWMALRDHPRHGHMRHTNQRAELLALLLALDIAHQRRGELDNRPFFLLRVRSDSGYVVKIMKGYWRRWETNGWETRKGKPVKNVAMIQEALARVHQLKKDGGQVRFQQIPREKNKAADKLANRACDEAADASVAFAGLAVVDDYESDSDSDYY